MYNQQAIEKQTGFANNFFWNLNTKYTEVPQSFILTHPFLMLALFQKYLNPRVRSNKWY